jgi:hypothetical protein
LLRRTRAEFDVGLYPLDYTFLDVIPKIPYERHGDLRLWTEEVDRRVILIGDLRDNQDSRSVPVLREPVPGVMVHAVAFATLNTGLLRYIDERTSWAIELQILVGIGVLMGLVQYTRASVPRYHGLSPHSVQVMSFTGAALGVLAWSLVFVGVTQYFWPNFLWITLALFITPHLILLLRVVWRGAHGFLFSAAREGSYGEH